MSLYTDLKAEYDAELERIGNENYSLEEADTLIDAASFKFQSAVAKARILCEIMGMTFDEQEDGTTADEVNDAQIACEEVSGWNMDYIVFTGGDESGTAFTESWLTNKEQFYEQCDEYFVNLLFNMPIIIVDGVEYTLGDIYSPDNIPTTSEDGTVLIEDLVGVVQAAQRDLAAEADEDSEVEIISVTELKIADDNDAGDLLLGNDRWFIDFALLNEHMDIDSNSITANSERILQDANSVES